MNHGENVQRKKWIAAVLGITMTGMGQIYNGEFLKGLSIFIICLMTFVAGLRLSVYLPDKYLIIGIALVLVSILFIYVFSIAEAYRKSSKTEYTLKFYNRWYVYIAIWMVGSLLITEFANSYTRSNVIQLYKIVTESMQPDVMKGDRIIVDNTAYRRMPPRIGDIVVFVYPDDRSKVYIKRIAGLPGNTIKLEGDEEYIIPHGAVYVSGDNRQKSQDSKDFGPVPLRDIVGKARQVCYSYGADGIRWDRIGLVMYGKRN